MPFQDKGMRAKLFISLQILALPHVSLGQNEMGKKLLRIQSVENCQVTFDSASLPQPNESYRVYVKKKGEAVRTPLAIISPQIDETGMVVYEVVGGSILPHSDTCREINGMIAISASSDPIAKANRLAIEETEPRETEKETLSLEDDNVETNEITRRTRPPKADEKNLANEETSTQEKEDNQKQLASVNLGLRAELTKLEGLYIDANIEASLFLIGPEFSITFFPFALIVENPWLTSIALGFSSHSLESARDLKIKREGEIVGEQETSLITQALFLHYRINYMNEKMGTQLTLLPWRVAKLRHSARFNAGIEGAGASLRDLEQSCLGVGLSQHYRLSGVAEFALGGIFCADSTAITPAITAAQFPNASTKFSDSTQLLFHLDTQVPLSNAGFSAFFLKLWMDAWGGALTLDGNQIIDSSQIRSGGSMGFSQSL